MAINVTLPTLVFPHRGEFVYDEFVTKYETAHDLLAGLWTTNANLFKDQLNTTEQNINAMELNVTNISTNAISVTTQNVTDSSFYASQALSYSVQSGQYANNANNSYLATESIAQGIESTALALTQIGISLSYIDDGELVMQYASPITNLSFNSENELIIEY